MDLLGRRRGSGPAAARQVAATVRQRYRAELAGLHRALFSDAGERDYGPGTAYVPPGFIARAVRDPLARVSVCADVGDLTDAVTAGKLHGPVAAGTSVVHVSIGGHHRFVERPRRLSPAEEEGWVRAVYGPQSEDAAYYGGHSIEITPLGIGHFFLFLGPDRTPIPPPGGWAEVRLRPITEPVESFGASSASRRP